MGKVATKSDPDTNQKRVVDVLVDDSNKEAPGHYSRGLSYWLKSGDFVPQYVWRECEGVEPTYPARHEA